MVKRALAYVSQGGSSETTSRWELPRARAGAESGASTPTRMVTRPPGLSDSWEKDMQT